MNSPLNIIWRPLPGSQTRFLTCPAFEVLMEGTRGGGKSDCMLMSYAQHVGRGFGADWTGMIFRNTYKQLDDIIAKSKKWFYRIFPDAKFNESDYVWKFRTGELLHFSYGDKADDYWNYHGHEYPFLGFEELTNWKDSEFYDAMLSTCRSSNPNVPRMVRGTTNPFGLGHNWVKDRWRIGDIAPEIAFGEPGVKRLYIHSALSENTVLMRADPNYIKTLEAIKDPNRRKAWLYGSWDIHVGTFLENVWNEKECVVDPFPVPESWAMWKSMDWGYSKPYGVLWFAQNPDGCVYVWRELYGCKEGEANVGTKEAASEVAKRIVTIEEAYKRYGYEYRMNLADPAIFANIGTSKSIGQIFRDNGVRWIGAWNAKGSRVIGAQLIVDMLAAGKLKFFRTCKNCIRTIPSLPPDPYRVEDVDTDCEDHLWDALRYGLMRKRRNPNADDREADRGPEPSGAKFLPDGSISFGLEL